MKSQFNGVCGVVVEGVYVYSVCLCGFVVYQEVLFGVEGEIFMI